MGTLYEITDDMKALNELMETLVDENGDPREPTEDELTMMRQWFDGSLAEFEAKIDNYCRFIKNLKIEAANVDAERKNYKEELDRLSKRAQADENKAKNVQGLLRWGMERLGMKKYKTLLFNLNIQNTQKKIDPLVGYDWHKIPEELLKVEVDVGEIRKRISAGTIITKDGAENVGKLFFDDGREIQGVKWAQGTALVIR